jgi:hypothetical protein
MLTAVIAVENNLYIQNIQEIPFILEGGLWQSRREAIKQQTLQTRRQEHRQVLSAAGA